MKEIIKIDENNLDEILVDLNEKYMEIPFGNSEFQNTNFVVNGELTPERAYRHTGLKLFDRIRALKHAKYSLQKEDVDMEELEYNISQLEKTEEITPTENFELRRLKIDLNEKTDNRKEIKKSVNDAIEEVNTLYKIYQSLPKFTRVEFEAGERRHYELSLLQQHFGIIGADKSLVDMGYDLDNLPALDSLEIKELLNTRVIDNETKQLLDNKKQIE